jgi:hypothetical protein
MRGAIPSVPGRITTTSSRKHHPSSGQASAPSGGSRSGETSSDQQRPRHRAAELPQRVEVGGSPSARAMKALAL